MRKTLKRAFTFVTAFALTLGMGVGMTTKTVQAGADIVLDGGGDPRAALIRTIDPGDRGSYKYIDWVYWGQDLSSDYKYLQVTYTGDATALEEVRLELVQPDGTDDGPGINTGNIVWFGENEEGTMKTVDGGMVPAPTDKEQTVVIDLVASGFDLSQGYRAFHIHSTPGKGTVTFTDARLMDHIPGESAGTNNNNNNNSNSNTNNSTSPSQNSDGDSDGTVTNTGNQTTGGGSVDAPKTGSVMYPIAIAVGGIVVAGIALVASRKLKEEN